MQVTGTTGVSVYPYPQWADFSGGELRLPRAHATVWLDPALAGPGIADAVRRLPLCDLAAADLGDAAIAVGLVESDALAALLSGNPLAFTIPAEGYCLRVMSDRVVIVGADRNGCLYGLSTLAQLLRVDGDSVTAPLGEVRDWPYKPMRGAHIYMPGRDDIPFFKELLAWMSSLHYNMLFLEVGGGMRYDRHPEVNEAWVRFCQDVRAYPGGPRGLQGSQPYPKDSTHTELAHGGFLEKEEVADIIRYANACGIEVVPELQSLSHAYYMCCAHPEIAERPYDPWPDTYCPSNPESYRLYFDLVDEVLEVFKPRMLHIGHDEVYTLGACDRCRGKSGADLLAGDLAKIRDYLAARGVRTVLWGDKLQNIIVGGVDHGGRARRTVSAARRTDHTMRETFQAVDFVPKDMLIMDWYWCLDPNSERFFQRKGFEVIYGNFGDNYAPQTFFRWDKRAADANVVGAEVSSWCDVSEYAFGHNLTFFNLIFSANMLWWSHYSDRERGTTLRDVARIQAATHGWLGGDGAAGCGPESWPIALGAAATGDDAVLARAEGQWTGLGAATFALGGGSVRTSETAPVSGEIAVGRHVAGLSFLHYAHAAVEPLPTWGFPNALGKDGYNLLGAYVVTYDDGTTEEIEIRYGDNVSAPNLLFGEDVSGTPFWAVPAWEGRDRSREPVTLWAHEWTNPHPDKQVTSLSLRYGAGRPNEEIALVAVTALV
ncbi:MAG: family 20 glycosylhydrolase [Anaerolineae bacterium]